MGRKHAEINVERRIKQGFGKGSGKEYKPWLTVQSFSSLGYANRVAGWKTGREHHFFSQGELDYFFVLEWSPRVVDIREQYPLLPVEETVAIAKALGVRHPTNPKTKEEIALTTDFLITARGHPRNVEEARTIKQSNELQSQRTLEKLEIEKRYWQARNVNWGIVTEADLSQVVVSNIRWLHRYFEYPELSELPRNCPDKIDHLLREFLTRRLSLAASAEASDDKLGLKAGVSLSLARHFIASRRWQININEKIDPDSPLKILNEARA